MAELPDEVLERLSTHPRVKLTVGRESATAADVHVAPLSKQLFLLVSRGGATEQGLLEETEASILAEGSDGAWFVRASGRAVVGRPVLNEPRRPELLHWLPDGVSPAGLVAVRFHPETVEYIQGRGATRSRAAGEVPEGKPPGVLSRWGRLASDRVVLWYFALAAIDWAGLLFLVEEPRRPALLLVLLLLSSMSLLGGVTLLDQAARFARWREGLETDADTVLMLKGWDPPRRVHAVGLGMMLFGGALAVVLAAGAGWRVGALAIVASAVPILGPFHLARHALRRKDAERETG
ncbi:MAG: hypothetical protein Q8P41_13535 [Pseudomonadota bacterium]|nr:hypothetical protein [Pseudomonadota bacterium]